ncbi:MAG: hypothetical protein FWB78_11275 [Treponema sp.]|nr:hypothetical protein [Treponema sp.]
MKMRKIFLGGMAVLMLASGLVLTGCGNDRNILGTWNGSWGHIRPATLIFHSDGYLEIMDRMWGEDLYGTFTARNGQITLNWAYRRREQEDAGTYTISGDTLRLDLHGKGSMTFRR